ncbi:hypothetical protein BJ138DRAFT_787283 [Hygrophoropsis aurantiaca]|uniref:Uncharacterized protein n=1 Tax=Hygrophoropsis aurantiaca TaxID=72124 RepID=A0ACB7ZW18_9AGAM|nr:hypothetical protein BJ138DRAFT_787283 [Hygrophoropsis aurantiaca]
MAPAGGFLRFCQGVSTRRGMTSVGSEAPLSYLTSLKGALSVPRPRPSRQALSYLCAYKSDVQVQAPRGTNSSFEQVEELAKHAREEGKWHSAELEQPITRIDADQLLHKLEKETAVRKGDVDALKQLIGLLIPTNMREIFDGARERVLEILSGDNYESWTDLCGGRSTTELLDVIERGLANVGQRPSRQAFRYLCAYGGDVRARVERRDNIPERVAWEELEKLAREEGKGHADSGPEPCIDTDQVLRELEKETAERKGDIDALQQVIGILIPRDFRALFDAARRRFMEEVPGCRYESWAALRGERSINELLDVIERGLVDGDIRRRPPRNALVYFCAYNGDVPYEKGRFQQEMRGRVRVSYEEERRMLDELEQFRLETIIEKLEQFAGGL